MWNTTVPTFSTQNRGQRHWPVKAISVTHLSSSLNVKIWYLNYSRVHLPVVQLACFTRTQLQGENPDVMMLDQCQVRESSNRIPESGSNGSDTSVSWSLKWTVGTDNHWAPPALARKSQRVLYTVYLHFMLNWLASISKTEEEPDPSHQWGQKEQERIMLEDCESEGEIINKDQKSKWSFGK